MRNYITLERILLVISLIVIILLVKCSGHHNEEIIRTIPEYIKTTDTVVFNHVVEKKLYLQGKTIYVDSVRYVNYHKADTIKKDSMYSDAIAIREYDTILEDNDRIKLRIHSKVSGRLINEFADYTIKEIEVKPVIQRPRTTLLLGVGTKIQDPSKLYLSVGLQSRTGFIANLSIDTNNSYSIGIYKAITILK